MSLLYIKLSDAYENLKTIPLIRYAPKYMNNDMEKRILSNTETERSVLKIQDNELKKEEYLESGTNKEVPYSVLTQAERYGISVLLSMNGIWSSVSLSIFFPALPTLSKKFHITPDIANLSVVGYLIFQGVSPTVLAFFADNYGRRPSILFCVIGYFAVCIALSQTNVFWLMGVLRCVQAAAIAPMVAIATGSVGDFCKVTERGKFVGLVQGIQLVGQGFGALLGAALVHSYGWRAIFVFLAIGSGATAIISLFILPETNRAIVGNMSVPATKISNQLPITSLPCFKARLTNDVESLLPSNSSIIQMLVPFKIIKRKEVLIDLVPVGFQYTIWTMTLTSLSTILETKYKFSMIHIGICYIPSGIGTVLGSLISGRILDWNYKRRKVVHDAQYAHLDRYERPKFNLRKVRLELCVFTTVLLICFSVVFGWCLQYKVNIAPILIATFVISFCCVSQLSAITTLLVDMYPGQGSALTSCVNFVRCILAAIGIGVLQRMIDAMGEGGTYTLMAGFCLIAEVVLYSSAYLTRKKLEEIDS